MDKNDEIFKGTSFSDLMSDVYHNSKKKENATLVMVQANVQNVLNHKE